MNQHSSLMRYKSAPSSLLSKYLDFQDWNDISGNCLNSIAESEGPGSVFDDPYESPRSKAVEKSPEIVGTTGSVKDVHMLDCFDPEASLDIFNLPDLADTWHPSEESKCQQEERTAKLAFADSIENVGCLSTSGVKRESTSPPTVTDRLNLRMAGVLRSTPHTHNSFIKEPVFQTTVKEASKIHSNDSKTSKSTLEGISSDVQMMNLYEKDGVTMLPSPYSLDFAVYPSIGFIKPEQTPYGRNNENCAPLARSSSLPVSTTSKNIILDNTSHYLGPCQTRAKRGCATHPRSIAERLRRTRISEKMKKLQELVPTSDKQLNTADMLDEAVEYVKFLQQQVKELSKDHWEVPMKTAELCESQQ